ncbi:MAG: ubiquinol-cytochrome C chaperone family protein, partial [Pseudomonadota bacterium]
RFDMISLHVILILSVLPETPEGQKMGQRLFDVMFKDMDKALREMGIGDLSVPKHMKRMMNGFNGRLLNYKDALAGQGDLNEVLERNVYGMADDVSQDNVNAMADYVRQTHQELKGQESKKILDGLVNYPEL